MQINIVAAGKLKNNHLTTLISDYLKRFKRFKIMVHEVDDKGLTKAAVNNSIFKHIKPSFTIALDEKGKSLNSLEFSNLLSLPLAVDKKSITFIIGGAEGLEKEQLKKVDLIISLSKLTFPHMLARLLLIEQLYRAETILTNHPYHKD